jgi:hypothetical protein
MRPLKLEDLNPELRRRVEASLARLNPPKPTPAPAPQAAPMVRTPGRQPNKTESLFNRVHLSGAGKYEAVTFRLPGGSRYTPDWVVWSTLGKMTCYEVKGAFRFGSQGRAAAAFRECVAAFPDVDFVWAMFKNREWQIQRFNSEDKR